MHDSRPRRHGFVLRSPRSDAQGSIPHHAMASTTTPAPTTASESPYRARLCARFMAAAVVLAAEAPDDFRRRIIARPVFVYAHEFVRWARRAKNELRRLPNTRHTILGIEPILTRFAVHDYGPYEVIRHRIAAHRQPLGATTDSDDELATAAAWVDISDSAVRILAEDARAVWNALADAYGMPRLTSFPPVTPELRRALNEKGFEPAPEGLVLGVGSFDATRPDALWVRQGGEIGQRQREVVDAIRSVQVPHPAPSRDRDARAVLASKRRGDRGRGVDARGSALRTAAEHATRASPPAAARTVA
jgi:hypothetical protein